MQSLLTHFKYRKIIKRNNNNNKGKLKMCFSTSMNDFNLTISGVVYMGMQAAPTTERSENTNRPKLDATLSSQI
jgi:hypothetical protein